MFRLCVFSLLILGAAGCTKPTSTAAQMTADLAAFLALPDDDAMAREAPLLQKKWARQRVRWQALATAGLCVDRSPLLHCAMNPFPRGGDDAAAAAAAALGGLFPTFVLDATAQQALRKECAGKTTCVVDVEATIGRLVLDPAEPLAVDFVDVVVHGGREPRDSDHWHRPPLVFPEHMKRPLELPEATPTQLPESLRAGLAPKTF